nr:hypothetical protein [uncultured Sphingomonas sp.]
MNRRPLFAILIAFAMLFAPLAAHGGAARAMTPGDHHGQMMKSGHCADQPEKGDHQKAANKSCCVAMCMAMAVVPTMPGLLTILTAKIERPLLTRTQRSFLAELPTPPPRLA